MINYLLNLLNIYNKSNFCFKTNTLSNKFFPIRKIKDFRAKNESLIFKTSKKINKGWYLFGIKYYGETKFVYGEIYEGNSKFNQGRPMNPGKFRWRVIRIRKNNILKIRLNNIKDIKNLENIWIIRLPKFEAWRRINKKIYELRSEHYNQINKKIIWLDYNKCFIRRIGDTKQEIYRNWISSNEKNSIYKLRKNNYRKNKFHLIKEDNIKKIGNSEWAIIFLEKGILSKWAYDAFNFVIAKNKNCLVFYTDEDCISKSGIRKNPFFKTSWNKELFISDPYYSGIWVVKGILWNSVLSESDRNTKNLYSIIYKLFLNQNPDLEKHILHLPLITFHRSLKYKNSSRSLASIENKKLIKNYLLSSEYTKNSFLDLKIHPDNKGYQTIWWVPSKSLLSIIIPTKNNYELLKSCIRSIYQNSPNINFEIIIINNDSNQESTKKYLKCLKNIDLIKIIDIPGEFNFSKFNNQASKFAKGNVLLFLNNDVLFLDNDWGRSLASYALKKGVGCVGGKLVYEDRTIQHGGVILGIGGVAGHAHKYFSEDSNGYQSRLKLSQEISAVTGACLAISKSNWEILNGFDQKNLKVNYNDVDLCLRARKLGLTNIYLPSVYAIHYESKTRGRPKGKAYLQWKKEFSWMKKTWGKILKNDPAYNPNLTLIHEDFSIGLNRFSNPEARSMKIE